MYDGVAHADQATMIIKTRQSNQPSARSRGVSFTFEALTPVFSEIAS